MMSNPIVRLLSPFVLSEQQLVDAGDWDGLLLSSLYSDRSTCFPPRLSIVRIDTCRSFVDALKACSAP